MNSKYDIQQGVVGGKPIIQKKENLPAAGFFSQVSSLNARNGPIPKLINTKETLDSLERTEKLIRLFVSCSGMQQYAKEVEKIKTGDCDEVILQALINGPKVTLEDFCAILNNTAVYASLFLSSTLGLLFSPPERISSLDDTSPNKIVYFVGIFISVVFNILNVLIAVIVFASKNKLLRESDALGYLIFAQNNIIMSSTFLTIGIVGLMVAVMPVLMLTFGVYALSCGVAVSASIIIPFAVWQYGGYLKRHAGYYFMRKGRAAAKQHYSDGSGTASQEYHGNGKDGRIHDQSMNANRPFHDPFDPTVAWYSYLKLRNVGMAFASRDSDLTGAVDMTEFASVLEADEERIEHLLQQTDLESGGSLPTAGTVGYATVVEDYNA